jgi:hypothetical protein
MQENGKKRAAKTPRPPDPASKHLSFVTTNAEKPLRKQKMFSTMVKITYYRLKNVSFDLLML